MIRSELSTFIRAQKYSLHDKAPGEIDCKKTFFVYSLYILFLKCFSITVYTGLSRCNDERHFWWGCVGIILAFPISLWNVNSKRCLSLVIKNWNIFFKASFQIWHLLKRSFFHVDFTSCCRRFNMTSIWMDIEVSIKGFYNKSFYMCECNYVWMNLYVGWNFCRMIVLVCDMKSCMFSVVNWKAHSANSDIR